MHWTLWAALAVWLLASLIVAVVVFVMSKSGHDPCPACEAAKWGFGWPLWLLWELLKLLLQGAAGLLSLILSPLR